MEMENRCFVDISNLLAKVHLIFRLSENLRPVLEIMVPEAVNLFNVSQREKKTHQPEATGGIFFRF